MTPARFADSGFADSTIKKPIGKNAILPSNLPSLGISSPIVEKLESSRPAHPCFSPKRREKNMIKEAIAKLINKQPLSRTEAAGAMTDIMSGNATDAQIGAFITGLRLTGETPETIAGCAEVMRANATPIQCNDSNAVDIVGTGGDCANTFNISTTAAFVIAGAGVTVAKHGSYGVSSKCGSANVLSELGVNLQYTPAQMEACLAEIGIAFLFAPGLHPAMKHVVGPRRELGIWSIFNILGPLCNPAGVKNGIMGVFSPSLVPIVSDR